MCTIPRCFKESKPQTITGVGIPARQKDAWTVNFCCHSRQSHRFWQVWKNMSMSLSVDVYLLLDVGKFFNWFTVSACQRWSCSSAKLCKYPFVFQTLLRQKHSFFTVNEQSLWHSSVCLTLLHTFHGRVVPSGVPPSLQYCHQGKKIHFVHWNHANTT